MTDRFQYFANRRRDLCFRRLFFYTLLNDLQLSQVKCVYPPQEPLMNRLFEKMNPLVVATTSIKFKSAFLHA